VGDELKRDGFYAMCSVVLGTWPISRSASNGSSPSRPSSPTCTTSSSSWLLRVLQWEFGLSVLAGVLAVLGYSVNESL